MVAVETLVVVAVAAVVRADCGVPHPKNFMRSFTSSVSTIPHLFVSMSLPHLVTARCLSLDIWFLKDCFKLLLPVTWADDHPNAAI